MGGLFSWFTDPPRRGDEPVDAEQRANQAGAEPVRPGPLDGVPLAPEVQGHHDPGIAPGGPNNIEPHGVPREPAKLPDSSYRYLTDPQGASSLAPLLALGSNADVKSFVENVQEQFSRALSLRRDVDSNSRRLRELVGRDESAELPACLTIWAEKAFRSSAMSGDIRIEYTDLRGERVISSITVPAACAGDDVQRINDCVQKTITSCHCCVTGVDLAIQGIMQQHKALSELRCRPAAVMTAMRCADTLCAELDCFASQALGLLNNFLAALSFFETRAQGKKTGLIAVILP